MRSGDGLADRRMRRRGGVRSSRHPTDRLAVALLAAAALPPSSSTALRCGARPTGAAAPAHRTALALRLAPLVPRELAGLLTLFTRERLRTERRRAELRSRSGKRRPGSAKATSATAASASTATPAPSAVLIAELRRRRAGRIARTGCRAWVRVARGFARGLRPALARRLVLGAL